jgi:hypothetical protein
MKIKLIRTGGFIPVTKAAEADVDISEDELAHLIKAIKAGPAEPRIKDGNYWELSAGSIVTTVNLEKVPEKFKPLFIKLKEDLRVIK